MNESEILVPISIVEEEKEILAIFSIRQFLLIFPPGLLMMGFLIKGGLPFVTGLFDFLLRLVITLVVIGFCIALAFVKLSKHEQYLNEFLMTQIKFMRSQKTYF